MISPEELIASEIYVATGSMTVNVDEMFGQLPPKVVIPIGAHLKYMGPADDRYTFDSKFGSEIPETETFGVRFELSENGLRFVSRIPRD